MSFELEKDIYALVQECLSLHKKHLELSGTVFEIDEEKLKSHCAQSSSRLRIYLVELMEYRHVEETTSNRHKGFGWSTEVIQERFTARVQKYVEDIYAWHTGKKTLGFPGGME
jgi:hypothetical protein